VFIKLRLNRNLTGKYEKAIVSSIAFGVLLSSCGSKTKGEFSWELREKKWYQGKSLMCMELNSSGVLVLWVRVKKISSILSMRQPNSYRTLLLYGRLLGNLRTGELTDNL